MDLHPSQSDESPESGFAFDIQNRISLITNRPLSPESIDTYADTALDDLVLVIESVIDSYRSRQLTDSPITQREEETNALIEAGLHPELVERTLDHVQEVVEQLQSIDRLIDQPPDHSQIIVPPGEKRLSIAPGSGDFKDKQVVPRTKTVLFIVAQEYGLEISDKAQVCVHPPGHIDGSMMRDHSYRLLEFPSLERAVLVCDEIGNITYVFDTALLEENDITLPDVMTLNKQDINFILDELPESGARITYSKESYVSRVVAAFDDVLSENDTATRSYLEPKAEIEPAPEGWLSRRRIADGFGVSFRVVERTINELGDTLHPVMVRFGSKAALAYSLDDQDRIRSHLEEQGVLTQPAPEGWLGISGIASKYNLDVSTVKRSTEVLSKSLEPVDAKFISVVTQAYSQEDQDKIRQYLEQIGVLTEEAPEGWLSCRGMADAFEIGHGTVGRAISELEGSLQPIQARFGPRAALAYSPGDQERVRSYLQEKGIFADKAPEGWLSARGIADRFGIGNNTVEKSVVELGDKLQPVQAKYKSISTQAYSPEDQVKIYDHLNAKGSFSDVAPDDWLGVGEMARFIDVDPQTVRNAIKELGEVLRPTAARFGTRVAKAYSPSDQQAIFCHLQKNPRLKQKIDDRYK